MKIRSLCIIICICMLSGVFCGCSDGKFTTSQSGKTDNAPQKNVAVTMLYNRADTFDPYTAKTELNRNLSLLIYDPLIRLDNGFNVDKCIAESVLLDGNVCTVKLKNVSFSDGSPVTAQDVIYTYTIAKKTANSYKTRFYEVASITASDSKTVVFTLKKKDPYFEKLLDFPIIKNNTAGKSNSDGVETAPVGCGRYILNKNYTELEINPSYYKGKGNITSIKLLHAPDEDSIAHYVEVGAASLYYTDISSGSIIRMSGKKTDVNLNAFVYIGINDKVKALQNKNMRYAISSAINRADICKNAYYNNAVCATGYFNPAIGEVAPVQTINSKSDMQITVENLDEIGYNRLNGADYYVSKAGETLTFSLLVNSENASRVSAANLIANQLKTAGIKINVVKENYQKYLQDIKSGNFQLYLGEINVLANMDFSPLVIYGGSAAFGVSNPNADKIEEKPAVADKSKNPDNKADSETTEQPQQEPDENSRTEKSGTVLKKAIDGFYSGESSLLNLAGTLLTEMPQIPICYRTGKLFYSSCISGEVEASQSDIYYSVNSYIIK